MTADTSNNNCSKESKTAACLWTEWPVAASSGFPKEERWGTAGWILIGVGALPKWFPC